MNAEALLAELEQEAKVTRRLLERVPDAHLTWRPGPKAMTLGQLAWHVATIPGNITKLARMEGIDAATMNFEPRMPDSASELLPAFDAALGSARDFLRDFTAETAAAPWRLSSHGQEVFTMPKSALLRTLLLNHWYHHRGQLVVYFRCLDVPVPAVYGRSADEALFG